MSGGMSAISTLSKVVLPELVPPETKTVLPAAHRARDKLFPLAGQPKIASALRSCRYMRIETESPVSQNGPVIASNR